MYYAKQVSESLTRRTNPNGLYAAPRAGVCSLYIPCNRKGTLLPLVLFGAKGSAKRHERVEVFLQYTVVLKKKYCFDIRFIILKQYKYQSHIGTEPTFFIMNTLYFLQVKIIFF